MTQNGPSTKLCTSACADSDLDKSRSYFKRQGRSNPNLPEMKQPIPRILTSKAAQIALDKNNYSTANARLTSNIPVALINEFNIQICRDLHPPSLAIPEPINNPRLTRLNKKKIEEPHCHTQPDPDHFVPTPQSQSSRERTSFPQHLC